MTSNEGRLHLSTGTDPDMGQVARTLRTAAAVHSAAGSIVLHVSPSLARRLAHHLDGGGFIDARKDVARMLTAEHEEWVTKCQGMMKDARRNNRQAQITLGLALAFLALGAGLIFWA
ncbi:hypothetical protein [Cypionkella sinensis]|uniref:Uncharacterized protein n=1 Tax=Cypionkella sinensis TaxID=1756043 RepID=A0ABV7J0L8_9RHOB